MKNDVRAEDLADLYRLGRLAEAWFAPPEVRELREFVRYRAKLVNLRTNLKLQVYAVLAKADVSVTDDGPVRRRGGQASRDLPVGARLADPCRVAA